MIYYFLTNNLVIFHGYTLQDTNLYYYSTLNNRRIWFTIHSIQFISRIFKIDYRQHEYSKHLLCSAVETSNNATRFTFETPESGVRILRQHSWCTHTVPAIMYHHASVEHFYYFFSAMPCNKTSGATSKVSITLIISCLYVILQATDSPSPSKFIRKYAVMFRIIKTSQNLWTAIVFERVCIMLYLYANSLLFFMP